MSPEPMVTGEIAARAAGHAWPGAFALVTLERSLMLRFADGRPTQSTAIDDVTVEIAVPLDGHVGRAATNAVDDAALAECAARARLAAEAASVTGEGQFPGFDPDPDAVLVGDPLDPDTAALDPAAGAEALDRRVLGGGGARRRGPRDLDASPSRNRAGRSATRRGAPSDAPTRS